MVESTEIKNASQFPRHYYARHMQPGVCGYENETVLVDTDAMKQMAGNSAMGKPVYLFHQNVDLKTMKEESCGYIIGSFYNELDGWDWFKILVIDDEAHAAIAKGWSVSNAYRPLEWGIGGTKNNVPYNREIKNGEFTHLAIVPDPRYEDACIMTPDEFKAYQDSKKRQLEELRNSKAHTSEGKTMFKLFKNERKEVTTVDADTIVELEGGKTITVAEMLNSVKKNDEAEAEKAKAKKEESDEEGEKKNAEKMNGDSMVKCNDGQEMPLKDLVNKYNAQEKKNADEKAAEDKKNADDEAAKKKKDDDDDAERKNNKKNFDELQNAHNKAQDAPRTVETGMDKLARGQAAYGLQKE